MIQQIEISLTPKSRGFHENRPEYEHTLEGADDMPAHAKSTLSGVSLTIPITNGRLNMGTWQGIYFCEYRNYGGTRKLVLTIIGE
jgi:secondary thiamine-phosphate synthase enzyme